MEVIAGPCAIGGLHETQAIAMAVQEAGATVFKAGTYKPLTFPPSMRTTYQRDPGHSGFDTLTSIDTTLPKMTEFLSKEQVTRLGPLVERIQIGARNQQNFDLLEHVARQRKPVMIKRHFGCSLRDLYGAVCYIEEGGSRDIWVCERGVVAPHTHGFRFLLDMQAVVAWRYLHPHIPIMVDCSHWIGSEAAKKYGQGGVFDLVARAAHMAVVAGADGLYFDVHPKPSEALVDPFQAITPASFSSLLANLKKEFPWRF